jgi:hypothetical protein
MAVPEPAMNDPEDLPPEAGEEPAAAPPARARPDWLVGAEEGVASEWTRTGGAQSERPMQVRLVRPAEVTQPESEEDAASAARRRLQLMGPDDNIGLTRPAGKPLPGPAKKRPTAWAAASSSVPTIQRSAPLMPQPKFNQLQDSSDPEQLMSPATTSLAETDIEEPTPQRPAAPAVQLAPLQESPWVVAMDALVNNRRLQILIGLLIVVLLAWMFWPRGEASTSVARLRHHPEQFDGRMVRISGKIGDVYAIAGGYTLYLLEGRDTMVVFTRTRVPVTDEHVSVRGTISTGYLDGVPRQALFEDGKQ